MKAGKTKLVAWFVSAQKVQIESHCSSASPKSKQSNPLLEILCCHHTMIFFETMILKICNVSLDEYQASTLLSSICHVLFLSIIL